MKKKCSVWKIKCIYQKLKKKEKNILKQIMNLYASSKRLNSLLLWLLKVFLDGWIIWGKKKNCSLL